MDADEVMHEVEMRERHTRAEIADLANEVREEGRRTTEALQRVEAAATAIEVLEQRLTEAERTIEHLRRYKADDANAY